MLAQLTGAWLIALLAGAATPGDRLEANYAAEMLRRLYTAMPGRMLSFRPGEPLVVLAAEAASAGAVHHDARTRSAPPLGLVRFS